MSGRRAGYVLWLLLAGGLYFFENNTGTRIVLCCALLFPLIPILRGMLFAADREQTPEPRSVTVKTFSRPEEEDLSGLRQYRAGDPVNRIHWKLSAKRNQWLIRVNAPETLPEETGTERRVPREGKRGGGRRAWILLCLAVLLLLLLCLLLIPAARLSARTLCNRLFEASEQRNAYAYARFPVPPGQSGLPAAVLLCACLALLLGVLFLSGSRLLALGLLAGCAVFQVYFGLAFPGWANVLLFTAFALWMAGRPPRRRSVLILLGTVLAISAAVTLLVPGVDAATEAASERARDFLSEAALQLAGGVRETEAEGPETRHTHTRTLIQGEGEAQTERAYRLETVEEEQVSMPRWFDWLRTVLLLLLTAALVVLPFLPFLWLNARRKKALEARRSFASEQVSEAVCAIFRQVIAWLEAMGLGAGNLPYREWAQHLPDGMRPGYGQRFSQGAAMFEEAAYSRHVMGEDQRRQVLALLRETEEAMLERADWRQRLRLRYGACLWTEKTD